MPVIAPFRVHDDSLTHYLSSGDLRVYYAGTVGMATTDSLLVSSYRLSFTSPMP